MVHVPKSRRKTAAQVNKARKSQTGEAAKDVSAVTARGQLVIVGLEPIVAGGPRFVRIERHTPTSVTVIRSWKIGKRLSKPRAIALAKSLLARLTRAGGAR
jgi:hypothetical protein